MPLAALALVADHYDELAIAWSRALADAPRRLHERRVILHDDDTCA